MLDIYISCEDFMETIKDQMKNLNMSANSYWQLGSYITVEMNSSVNIATTTTTTYGIS